MVYAAINEKDEKLYTYLPKLFDAIGNAQLNYNWLVTDCFCNISNPVERETEEKGWCWISGAELTELVSQMHIQWIFAVLSAFPPDVPPEEVLRHPLPFADCNPSFWHNPVSIQHPLAVMEIVPWDASRVLFFSREKAYMEGFMRAYPQSEDLSAYNERW